MVELHAWESHLGAAGGGLAEYIPIGSKVLVFAQGCALVKLNTDTVLAMSGECGSLRVCCFQSESHVPVGLLGRVYSLVQCFLLTHHFIVRRSGRGDLGHTLSIRSSFDSKALLWTNPARPRLRTRYRSRNLRPRLKRCPASTSLIVGRRVTGSGLVHAAGSRHPHAHRAVLFTHRRSRLQCTSRRRA